MKYLEAQEILILHSEIIDQTSGMHGVRDIGLFLSILEKPKSKFSSKELYKGIFQKAAVYLESIVQYHVFLDGNKRTAAISSARFLYLNGYELVATNRELENFVIQVAIEKLDLKIISVWLKGHTRKIRS